MPINRNLLPVFVVVFIDLLGFSIILPLLPYYASSFHASPSTIGYLIATYSIFQFIASPALGNLSDRYGRKPVLLYSQFGSFVGFLLLAAAGSLPHSLVWLFVSRAIDGLSGGNVTVAQAYISDVTRPEDRAKSFGLIIGLAFGFSFLIGPGLGGFLSRYGYSLPAYVAAFFALSSLITTAIILPEPEKKTVAETRGNLYGKLMDYARTESMRRLYYIFFLFSLFFSLFVTTFALYADRQLHLTAEQAGYTLAGVGFLGIIWQGGLIGPLVKRLGERNSLLLGMMSSVAGYFMILLVDEWWKLGVAAIFISFGNGIIRPSLTSLLTHLAPADRRGGALGVAASIESLSRIAAPILGGWIIVLYPSWIGLAAGILASLALLISLTLPTAQHDYATQE